MAFPWDLTQWTLLFITTGAKRGSFLWDMPPLSSSSLVSLTIEKHLEGLHLIVHLFRNAELSLELMTCKLYFFTQTKRLHPSRVLN